MNAGKTTIEYKKDDVWLCKGSCSIEHLTIADIAAEHVRHDYGWEHIEKFHNRAIAKIGRVRRIFGIPFGWARDK